MFQLFIVQDGYGYRDVDVYIRDGEGEWLFRVFKDAETNEITQCEPRFAKSLNDDMGDEGEFVAPAHVLSEMECAYPLAVRLLNDASIPVGAQIDSSSPDEIKLPESIKKAA